MTRRLRAWPLIALATVAGMTAASCGGLTPDDANSAASLPADGESAAGAATGDAWDESDGPGIVTLRPVVTCDPDATLDRSLGEAFLPHVGDSAPCVVGPSAGTGRVFERDSAVVAFDETTEQWGVDVDLRAAGQVVFDALAQRCLARTDGCESGQIAVVLDDVIQSAPMVHTPQFPGTIRISGEFTEEQARALARAINRDTTPAEPDADSKAASDDEAATADAARPAASTSVPVSAAATTTTVDVATDRSNGFLMPAMCGLPVAEWSTDEHPANQDQGTWATGSRDEGDIDGDGRAEFAWATVCGQGTVAVERAIHVFDSERRLMGTLPIGAAVADTYPDRTVHALEPRIVGEDVQVEVWVWQSNDATCCPSVSFEMSFAWDGVNFVATTPVPDPATAATPTGETPVVDWDGEYRPKTSPGRVVRLGEVGRQVELLQQALDERGYAVDVDGFFGRGTEAAVRQFQRDNGLPVTGIATDDVWDEFGE